MGDAESRQDEARDIVAEATDAGVSPTEYMLSDDDLPGMWSHSDFEGGDPDDRSYAERGWAPTEHAILCGPKPPTKGDLEEVAKFAAFLEQAGPPPQRRPPVVCPECAQGKHPNCTGDALDESTDTIVDCQCPRCI